MNAIRDALLVLLNHPLDSRVTQVSTDQSCVTQVNNAKVVDKQFKAISVIAPIETGTHEILTESAACQQTHP